MKSDEFRKMSHDAQMSYLYTESRRLSELESICRGFDYGTPVEINSSTSAIVDGTLVVEIKSRHNYRFNLYKDDQEKLLSLLSSVKEERGKRCAAISDEDLPF